MVPYSFASNIESEDKAAVFKALKRFNKEMSGCINIRCVEKHFFNSTSPQLPNSGINPEKHDISNFAYH